VGQSDPGAIPLENQLHPEQPYIVYNDLPKIDNLKRLMPDVYREKPVLVSPAAASD
jgi:peptide-methionine (S)-S-oxide reductase